MSSRALGEFGTVSGAVVLLSAGLDSSYNLVRALEKFSVHLTLTFNYGQRAAVREIERARALSEHYLVKHKVVELPWFGDFSRSALTAPEADGKGAHRPEVPRGVEVEIDNIKRSLETAERVWVPNRNGIFLSIAAGFAEGLDSEVVIPGFNKEEAATFPDNSGDFLRSMDDSLSYSTQGRVRTFCFSTEMDKIEIVRDSLAAGLDLTMLWPCYLNGPEWCGDCESCKRFSRAVQANGVLFSELKQRSGVLK